MKDLTVLLAHMRGYRAAFASVVALSLLEAILAALSITTLIPVGAALVTPANPPARSANSWSLSAIIESWVGHNPINLLLLLAGLLAVKVFVSIGKTVLASWIKQKLWQRWSHRLATKFLNTPYQKWQKEDSGHIINIMINELNRAINILPTFVALITQLFSCAMIFVSMLFVDWRVVAMASVLGSIIYFSGLRQVNYRVRQHGTQAIKNSRKTAGVVADMFRALRDIRLLQGERQRLSELDKIVRKSAVEDFKDSILQALPGNGIELILAGLIAALALTVLATGPELLGPAALPVLLYFLVGLFRLTTFAANVATFHVRLVGRYPSLLVVLDGMKGDEEEESPFDEIATSADPQEGLPSNEWKPAVAFEIKNLSISHAGPQVLRNVDIVLPVHTITYLFGPSGSGKSSIADIVSRLKDPPAGCLFVDGRDALEAPLSVWRTMIGYVPQEPYLSSGTLLDNLSIGKSITRARALEALDMAGASDFVKQLPRGLDTSLAESARTLSGGQRCRLAIARALVRDPVLLLLDESMGGLEPSIEADIIQRLRESRITTLVISHRWENANLADQVCVLDSGVLRVHKPIDRETSTSQHTL